MEDLKTGDKVMVRGDVCNGPCKIIEPIFSLEEGKVKIQYIRSGKTRILFSYLLKAI